MSTGGIQTVGRITRQIIESDSKKKVQPIISKGVIRKPQIINQCSRFAQRGLRPRHLRAMHKILLLACSDCHKHCHFPIKRQLSMRYASASLIQRSSLRLKPPYVTNKQTHLSVVPLFNFIQYLVRRPNLATASRKF